MARYSRRELLTAGAAAPLVALAGCTETNFVRYRVDSPAPFVDSDPAPPDSLRWLDAEPEAVFERLLVGEPTEVVDPAENRPRRIFVHNAADERRSIEIEIVHDWTFGDALVVLGDVSFPADGVFAVELYPPADYRVSVGASPTVESTASETLRFDRSEFDGRRHFTGVTVGADWVIESRIETDDTTR